VKDENKGGIYALVNYGGKEVKEIEEDLVNREPKAWGSH